MANQTECQTPGAVFNTQIGENQVVVNVVLPFELCLDEQEAQLLETNLHNAVELVLAPYWEREKWRHRMEHLNSILKKGVA